LHFKKFFVLLKFIDKKTMSLTGPALNATIEQNTSNPCITICDLACRVFGDDRVEAFLNGEQRDPVVGEFMQRIHGLVDTSWAEKGVSAEIVLT
jgi:hypothetical protein